MRASDFKGGTAEAVVFHRLAGEFLAHHHFFLTNDPAQLVGRFNFSSAAYRSPRGLGLSALFEPGDSNGADVHFGRMWSHQGRLAFLSNRYPLLARRYGFDIPMDYQLGYGDQVKRTIQTMHEDLMRTLPTVLSRVTLQELCHRERGIWGAAARSDAFRREFRGRSASE